MKEKKLNQLIAAARKSAPPAVPADFANDVLRAVRREPAITSVAPHSLFEHLNFLFPRLALVAAILIVFCLTVHLTVSGPEEEAAQVTVDQNLGVEDL